MADATRSRRGIRDTSRLSFDSRPIAGLGITSHSLPGTMGQEQGQDISSPVPAPLYHEAAISEAISSSRRHCPASGTERHKSPTTRARHFQHQCDEVVRHQRDRTHRPQRRRIYEGRDPRDRFPQ